MVWKAYNALVNDPQLLVLDSRDASIYKAGHIRGAVCVRMNGGKLEYVMGAQWTRPDEERPHRKIHGVVWSPGCWWGKNVLLVPGVPSDKPEGKKRKITETVADPVAKFFMKEGLVGSLKILEDDEGKDGYETFAKRFPFLVAKSLKAVKLPSYPAEIIPRLLYLGTREHANSADIISDLHITHILTVHTEPIKEQEGCTHLFFDIADEPTAPISSFFQKTCEFIEEVKGLKGRALVHCGAGASRSVTLVAFYLMRINQWNVDETLKFLKEQRKEVQPNPGFISALRRYEIQQFSNELVLHVHKGGEIVSSINVGKDQGDLLFGRQPTCDVVLDHASISRQHAKVMWSEDKLYIVDLKSAHGTFMDGKRLSTKRELQVGDVITFGASTRKYMLAINH